MKKFAGLVLFLCLAIPSFPRGQGYEGKHFYITPCFGLRHDTTSTRDLFGGIGFEYAMCRQVGIGLSIIGADWDGWFEHRHNRHGPWLDGGRSDWAACPESAAGDGEEGYGLITFDGIAHFLSLLERRIDLFAGIGVGVSVTMKSEERLSETRIRDEDRHHHDLAFKNVRMGPFVGAKFFISRRFAADLRIYESVGRMKGVCFSFGMSFKI